MARPSSLYVLGENPELRTTNLGVYSHPGIGKTAIVGTGGERMLILDSDIGVESAEAMGSKARALPVRDYDELEEAYQWLKNDVCRDRRAALNGDAEFQWFWWDSLTLFQWRALLDDILPEAVADNPRQDEDVPSQREYLKNMNRIGRYFRQFVDLPLNFGCSFHVIIEKDSDGQMRYMPEVQGKNMPGKIAGYLNMLGYLGLTPDGTRRLLLQPEGKFYAKDRFHTGVARMDDPSVPKIDTIVKAARAKLAKPTPVIRKRRHPVTNNN